MSTDPTDIRSVLEGVSYPATKADLMAQARENDADDRVLAQLEQLPDGMTFSTTTEVSMRLKDSVQSA